MMPKMATWFTLMRIMKKWQTELMLMWWHIGMLD